MDVNKHNSKAWDYSVKEGNIWTKPVSKETIEMAKKGEWKIFLTSTKPVPGDWLPDITGLNILCLASGGGQQGPVLAAAGANVTVLDNSSKQLEQDRSVARRDGLEIKTVKSEMSSLDMFADASFDLVVHPVSNLFVDKIRPVWQEIYRILKYGGSLLAGFVNPLIYIFDPEQEDEGILQVVNSIPYSDLKSLPDKKIDMYIKKNIPFEFGHTLEDQIQGQIDTGFVIAGLYEDNFGGVKLYDKYINTLLATRALKLKF